MLVAIAVSVAQLIPAVRAVTTSFIGIFREGKPLAEQLSPDRFPAQLGTSIHLYSMLGGDPNFSRNGLPIPLANPAEAQGEMGIPLRFPTAITSKPSLLLQRREAVDITVESKVLNASLAELKRSDLLPPAQVDGTHLRIQVPVSLLTQYGNCTFDPQSARQQGYDPDNPALSPTPDCTSLLQMALPSISAPAELELPAIGAAFLQAAGVPPQDADRYAANIAWQAVMVLPLPRYATSFDQVQVDGSWGTIFVKEYPDIPVQYLIFWTRDGIFYALSGPGDHTAALKIANSLE